MQLSHRPCSSAHPVIVQSLIADVCSPGCLTALLTTLGERLRKDLTARNANQTPAVLVMTKVAHEST